MIGKVVRLVVAAAAVMLGISAEPARPASGGGAVGTAVCAVAVSGTPVPGTPSMLPDGTGTCA